MKQQTLSVQTFTTAPAEAVWDLVGHVSTWTSWAPFERAELERTGEPEPDGVGAIRVFHRGRYVTREEVTAFVPGRRLEYRLLSGLPLDSYRASVSLTATPFGTDIRWESTFQARHVGTGWIFRRGMARLYRQYAGLLAEAATQRVREGSSR